MNPFQQAELENLHKNTLSLDTVVGEDDWMRATTRSQLVDVINHMRTLIQSIQSQNI